jgi:hypothetical protein
MPYDDKTIEDPERDRFYPLRIVGSYFSSSQMDSHVLSRQ